MIGYIDVEVNAANPQMPLGPFYAPVNSPSNVRVRRVPDKIGNWEITKVYVSVAYPDNSIASRECTRVGDVHVATLAACATVGASAKGFQITADGVDERGNAVTGYVLGIGDAFIMNRDGTITVGETTYYFHLLDAAPTTPKKGDVAKIDGVLKYYDGTAWQPFSESVAVVPPSTDPDDSGKPADAKATGDALALRPTKSQIDAGWWSEWVCEPSQINGVPVSIKPLDPGWTVYLGDSFEGIGYIGDENSSSLEFVPGESTTLAVPVTATRHRICAPVPTKPEDIGAQPALGFTPESVANKVTSITSESTDVQYPSAKAVHNGLSVMLTRQEAADGYTSWQSVPAGYAVEWRGYDTWGLVRTSDSTIVALAYADYNETVLAFDKPGAPGEYINVTRELLRPTKTSQLTNDGNGTSAFALLSELYTAVRNLAPDFTAKAYVLNELCTYNGVFYRCKLGYTATSSSAKPSTDTTHWEAKKASEIFLSLTGGTITGDVVLANSNIESGLALTKNSALGSLDWRIYVDSNNQLVFFSLGDWHSVLLQRRDGTLALLSDIGIPAFSTTATYAVGAKVVYDNALWNCTTAVSTAGAWAGATNWAKVCNLAADATPTANSANLMTSGAIKTALDSIKSLKHDESGYYIEV